MDADHDRASGPPAAASGVDVLLDVLRRVRLTGSMLFLVDAHPPRMSWAPRTEALRRVVLPASQHLISYHIITQGSCWAALRDAPPERFDTGGVLVVPHGEAYCLADPPRAAAAYGPAEAVAFFRRMAAGEMPSIVSEGGAGKARTQFICGFLGCDLRPCNPVLAALPAMIHLGAADRSSERMRMRTHMRMHHLIEFALCELREPSSGGRSVLLRLAELMFVEVVRRHLETMAAAQSGWLAGLHDPLVARTLSLLHGAPSRRWTLEGLAAQAGTSRSVLAKRFAHFVGQPPIQYLTQWRMQLATHLLAEPGRGSSPRSPRPSAANRRRRSAAHSRSTRASRLPPGGCATRPDARTFDASGHQRA
ncbi:MAG TPA: cupin domain-containing protein [Rubrivivax sp.]|nr:cupin domain-containing protein [Rubrivivax sp.]